MAFIEPMHRNKPNITYLLTYFNFWVNNILAGLWLNCISSVEITFFLLVDILLQHRALFQCKVLVKSF